MNETRESPKQLRAKERVDLVMKAAMGILAERGYGGMTLSAVCERAGVKQTSIYRYWPNRTALLISLLGHFEQEFQARIKLLEEVAFDTHWRDIQKMLLRAMVDFTDANPWVYSGVAAVRSDMGVSERHEQTLDFFAARVGHLLKIGGFCLRGDEEARVSRTHVQIVDSYIFAIGRAKGSRTKIDQIIDDYSEVIVNYLAPYMPADDA